MPMAKAAELKQVLIVGGVAGGASCAARLRRLNEAANIIVFERGPFVSFANCGLPYFVGDVIQDESKLLVASAARFKNWFNVDVKENTEVVAIHCQDRTVVARNVVTGEEATYSYDKLVLAPGAAAVKPPLPGVDLPGVFQMKTVPDSKAVKAWIKERGAQHAVVVGGGFIGLEMVENLVHLGLRVTLVEMLDQIMPPFDPEMVQPAQELLKSKGVELCLGDGLAGFAQEGERLVVTTANGRNIPADLAMLVIGVRPETGMAKASGLALGKRGGIVVDAHMATSDPHIYAVGGCAV